LPFFVGPASNAQTTKPEKKSAVQVEGKEEMNLKSYISFMHKGRVEEVLFTPDGSKILNLNQCLPCIRLLESLTQSNRFRPERFILTFL
jgi:hypothetical protein